MNNSDTIGFGDRLTTLLVGLMPTRLISRAARRLAVCQWRVVRRLLIHSWCRAYPQLDLSQAAESDPDAYSSFERFFTRELAAGTRPMPHESEVLAAPVDGTLGACGRLDNQTLVQSKGKTYQLSELLAGAADPAPFIDGYYTTFYLAPADYHRVHMPVAGELTGASYVPGRLFGVGPSFVRAVPGLFTRNERVVLSFATETGPMAIIFVGAFIVGGIHTRWHRQVCPPHRRQADNMPINDVGETQLERGDYVGHFSIGSSVLVLSARGGTALAPDLTAGQPCHVGQTIGELLNAGTNQRA